MQVGLHWVVQIDDIIVFNVVQQHLKQLRDVLVCLRNAGLKVKPAKCHLLKNRVHYLGYARFRKGEAVCCRLAIPVYQKQMQCFMGTVSLSQFY